jgi:hypothetical protein
MLSSALANSSDTDRVGSSLPRRLRRDWHLPRVARETAPPGFRERGMMPPALGQRTLAVALEPHEPLLGPGVCCPARSSQVRNWRRGVIRFWDVPRRVGERRARHGRAVEGRTRSRGRGSRSADFLRTLALPGEVERWSLTSLRETVVKVGAKVIAHGRSAIFQMAEVAVPRELFGRILDGIARLRPPDPAPC